MIGLAVELQQVPSAIWIAAAALCGAVMASFAGVVAERLPHQLGLVEEPEPGLSISLPASRCDVCRRPLDIISLVPVFGYFVRRGRCPCREQKVSGFYPAIEAVVALLSALIVAEFGPTAPALALLVLLWSGLTLAWTDYLHHVLPEAITMPLFWGGLLLSPFEPDPYARMVGAFAGFAMMWLAFRAASLLRGERVFAGGDIMLAAAGGAWVGIEFIPTFIGAASVCFLLQAIPARRRGIVMVAFGPALSGAMVLTAAGIAMHLITPF